MQHPMGHKAFPTVASSLTVPPPLRAVQGRIACCTTCPSMKPWRRFGPDAYGNHASRYVLVGEAPGYGSWKKGRRFTGPAGLLIRRALQRVEHPRYRDLEDLFYLTDVVKCHPAAPGSRLSNRAPRRSEVEACSSYLLQELEVLQPSILVTFGKMAAEGVGRALDRVAWISSSLPDIIRFPHPSPRNQRTILQQYASMKAFEAAITQTFRDLIAGLEA